MKKSQLINPIAYGADTLKVITAHVNELVTPISLIRKRFDNNMYKSNSLQICFVSTTTTTTTTTTTCITQTRYKYHLLGRDSTKTT